MIPASTTSSLELTTTDLPTKDRAYKPSMPRVEPFIPPSSTPKKSIKVEKLVNLVQKSQFDIVAVSNALKQMRKTAQNLQKTKVLKTEDLNLIWDYEAKIREWKECLEPISQIWHRSIQPDYDELTALLKRIKTQIALERRHLTTVSASEKGLALQAGLRGLAQIKPSTETDIPQSSQTRNAVILLPSTDSVLKQLDARSSEEEQLIDDLMSLSMERGPVPLFAMPVKRIGLTPSVFSEAVHCKPFVKDMFLLGDLLTNQPQLSNAIFARLNHRAELLAVLTAEFQLLDMHDLGVAPVASPEFAFFSQASYSYRYTFDVDFKQLLSDYLEGKITDATQILCKSPDNSQIYHQGKRIKDIPELLKALNTEWEFVLFDTDLALSESNTYQMQKRHETVETLIPYRSILIQTGWRDRPLSSKTLEILEHSKERETAIRNWVERDISLYKKVISRNPQLQTLLKAALEQKEYNLSIHRQKSNLFSLKDLNELFANNFSSLAKYKTFWELMQKELKSKENLVANTIESENKRKHIARQIFPRLTWRQKQGLYERQQRRAQYLESYRHLQQIHSFSNQTDKELKAILTHTACPLSSLQRETFLVSLKSIHDESSFLRLKAEIQQQIQPTYFNLVKAIYPCLADVYDLYILTGQYNTKDAGNSIGLYTHSLESTIQLAKTKHDPKLSKLAEKLEKQIEDLKKQDPAFFGNWL